MSSFSIYWNTGSCSKRLEFWDSKKEPENTSERCRYWVPLQTFSDSSSCQLVLDMSKPKKLMVQQSQVETRHCMFHPQCDVTISHHAEWHLHCWLCLLPFHHTFSTHGWETNTYKFWKLILFDAPVSLKGREEIVPRPGQITMINSKSCSATCEAKKPQIYSQLRHSPKNTTLGMEEKAPYKSFNWAFLSANISQLPEDRMGNTRQ